MLEKLNIINSHLDGVPEILLHGDLGTVDSKHVASLISNISFDEGKEKLLRIRINSFGGSVLAAYAIIASMNAFFDAGGEIETINEGRADSALGWIFSFGTRGRRKIMQFAGMFLHQPLFEDGTTIKDLPEGDESRKLLEREFQKLIDIFVAGTGISPMTIKRLMENESDLDSDQVLLEGFADKKVMVSNIPRLKNGISRAQIVNITSALDFDIIGEKKANSNKKSGMKFQEILNLNPEASDESVKEAIEALYNRASNSEAKLKTANSELEVVNASIQTVTAERDKLQIDLNAQKDLEVTNYVDALIKADASKKESRESLINMAKGDFKAFKLLSPLKVVDAADIEEGIEAEGGAGGDDNENELVKAKEFQALSFSAKNELKNSNYNEFLNLSTAYDKRAAELF